MIPRLVAVMVIGNSLSACASRPQFEATPPSKALILEETLAGRTVGDGAFINSITGGETKFSVVIDGSWDGEVLTLVEDFTFTDGTTERKTWHLTKTAEGRYSGTREDVIDTAHVHQDGVGVRLDYDVTLSTGLGDIDVRFEDLLFLQPDGTIANKAVVSKFGLRVGRVNITMKRSTRSS